METKKIKVYYDNIKTMLEMIKEQSLSIPLTGLEPNTTYHLRFMQLVMAMSSDKMQPLLPGSNNGA